MIKAALINTLQRDFRQGDFSLGNSRKNQPLDLALIGAILLQKNIQVKIIDANLLRLGHARVGRMIRKFRPELTIINTAAIDRWECPLPTLKEAAALSNEIKQVLPATLVAAVGPHGTITPNQVLDRCPGIDILVRGEPEITVGEIAANFEQITSAKKKILGISYVLNKKIVHNPDRPYQENLDRLPIPAYQLLPMEKYGPMSDHFDGGTFSGSTRPFSIMLVSRGCPGRCVFCFKEMYQGKRQWRSRSPEKVIEEIKLLNGQYGVKAIYFQDLNFCTDREWVAAICRGIIRQGLKFSWGCEARFDQIDQETAGLMGKAGCSFINFGLESGSETVLFRVGKNIKIPQIERAIADCRRAGIAVGCFKLLGLPGETKYTFRETLQFMLRNRIDIPYPFPIVKPLPYPGTELHQQGEKQFKVSIDWDNAPEYAGRIGTNFFAETTPTEIQRLAYSYRLKQENKNRTKHYYRLLLTEKLEKLKRLPSTLFSSLSSLSFSSEKIIER